MLTEVIVPSIVNSEIFFHNPVKCKEMLCPWHIHDECEFIMVTEGQMFLFTNENDEYKYIVEKGDIIFVNSRVPHKTQTFNDTYDMILQANLTLNTSRTYKYLFRYIDYTSTDATIFKNGTELNTLIKECLDKITSENTTQDTPYDLFIKSYVTNIFALLYRYKIIKNPQDYFNARYVSRLIPVLNYINENYSEDISLDYVSSILNVNKSHFCRIFKQAINVPFVQYVNFVRTYNAAKLLLTTEKNVSEISEEVGFSSPSYFAKEFKNNIGCSPNHYKKMKFNNQG